MSEVVPVCSLMMLVLYCLANSLKGSVCRSSYHIGSGNESLDAAMTPLNPGKAVNGDAVFTCSTGDDSLSCELHANHFCSAVYLMVFYLFISIIDDYFFVIIIRIMHVLCIGNICVAKDNFPLTMFERDNKGILFIYF